MARKVQRSRRSRRTSTTSGLSLSFSGPIRLNTHGGQDQRPVKVNLSASFPFLAESGGILRYSISNSNVATTSDWSTYADVYQEFRVLGIQVQYTPYYNGNVNASVTPGAGLTAAVHVPLTALPGTLDEVARHVTWRPFSTSKPYMSVWRMFGVEESTFINTSSPSSANHGGLLLYADSLTSDAAYGLGTVTYLVEFRGKK